MGSYSIPPKARGEALVRTACILIGIGLGVGLSALVALVLFLQKVPYIFGDGQAATTDPITRYTLWLVILTAVLAAANIGLWIYAGRQASDINQYVVATRNTASAARESAEIARTALTRGSRAFIIPKDLTFFWHPNETTGKFWWELAPIWENAGQTPTRDMRINVNSYFESSQLPADFGFPPAPGESVPLFIGPKATAGGDSIIKTGEELLAVRDGQKYFYIWGWAKYRDVFDGTPNHLTRFAWRISIFGDPTRPQDASNVVRYFAKLVPRHNCVDEECERQGRTPAAPLAPPVAMHGAAGEDEIWRAPAKSGYEIAQRKLGLPVDPYMRQFGRGGAVPGYEPKLAIIEQLRAAYFTKYSKSPKTIFEDINAVPLSYLNNELVAKKEIWRVRIIDDEYECFIPKNK
jgi:hypothetical protein